MSLLRWIFQAPKPATYSTTSFPSELCWFPWEQSKIPCLWAPHQGSHTVLLYLHGNASDLGTDRDFVWRMRSAFQVNVLAVEFPGYGPLVSWELPSEERFFQRVHHVCAVLAEMPSVETIIVMGYSLGATAAIHLAAHLPSPKVKALILYSPFSSLHDLIDDVANNPFLAGTLKRLVPNHAFHNHQTIQDIHIPIAIFHGNLDQLIPLRHSEQLSRAAPNARLVILEGMTHHISATTRSEAQLFEQTRDFLSSAISPPSSPPLLAAISFPDSYWNPPSLLRALHLPDGDESFPTTSVVVGVGLALLIVLALYMLRHCHKHRR